MHTTCPSSSPSRFVRSSSACPAQAVVDDEVQVIVAAAVTNQTGDAQHFPTMIAAIEESLGRPPVQALGDAGTYEASMG